MIAVAPPKPRGGTGVYRRRKPHQMEPVHVAADGKWHHVVATREGAVPKVYVDAQLVKEDVAMDGDIGGDKSNWYLGQNGGPGNFLVGSLDEVRIYSSALTQAEGPTVSQKRIDYAPRRTCRTKSECLVGRRLFAVKFERVEDDGRRPRLPNFALTDAGALPAVLSDEARNVCIGNLDDIGIGKPHGIKHPVHPQNGPFITIYPVNNVSFVKVQPVHNL